MSFQTSLKGKCFCSLVNLPIGHSFTPSQSHQVSTFFVFGSTSPFLNSGKGFCFSGIGTFPTTDTIFLFTAAPNGKKVEKSGITYDLFDCKNNQCINSDVYEYFDDKNNLQIYVNGSDGGSVIDYFGVVYQYKTMIHPNGDWVNLK